MLLDLSHTLARDYLAQFACPWDALAGISDFILELGSQFSPDGYSEATPNVWVHKSTHVFPSAYLGAPCIIGPETEVRHGAFVRSSALAGVVLGDFADIGCNSVLNPGTVIGRRTSVYPLS